MAENAARATQYAYRQNANLVLQAEKTHSRAAGEATGEVESLRGKINPREFGSLAQREKPPELEELKSKRRKREQKRAKAESNVKELLQDGSTLLGKADEWAGTSYRPKSKETRALYQQLLEFVHTSLGDQPQDIIKSAAEEILGTLKDEGKRLSAKKTEVEDLLGPIGDEKFAELTDIAKNINDYSDEGEAQKGPDDETGVSVIFDESDSEEADVPYEVNDEDSDEEEEAEGEEVERQHLKGQENAFDETQDDYYIKPREIDAHWMQRQISQFVDDAETAQSLANQVLEILETGDDRSCENDLVYLLEYERFGLIRVLLRNRLAIIWCTRLGRAASDAERSAIEQRMKENPETQALAESLFSSKKRTDLKRQEARNINRGEKLDRAKEQTKAVEFGVKPKALLDLDEIGFGNGAHTMSNEQCRLPPGSFRKTGKGFEEIHIPASKAPAFLDDEKLVTISSLPEWAHGAFAGVQSLNRIQSRVFPVAFGQQDNLLMCAPTGAGKTNVAMLTILQQLGHYRTEAGELDLNAFKIVYVAPMKALVQEMVRNFTSRLSSYGIQVRELSGDQNLTKQQISDTHIIVTTPEKWDIITRKSGDRTYTDLVRLIIIDEIHLLHDERGPVLEAIVARTIRQVEESQQHIRLVGLSATLPNYEDVGLFLRVQPEHVFYFDGSYRPVPLQQTFIGLTEKKALKRFQLMNELTYEKVMEHAGKSQVLVFVHSRKETAKTAKAIRDMALEKDTLAKFLPDNASREVLSVEAEDCKNADLKDLLPYGIAIHHAGMTREDRTLVEDLFADRHVQLLVSTSTLAWGVNLPAHCVIIKGTQIYNPEQGRWVELSPLDVMQMLGRAGRPAFDTQGEGTVITSHSELQFYLSLMNQQLPIESQMIKKLPDMLNAEIVLGSVQNAKEAVAWLGYTYLYICMLRNPQLYGITEEEFEQDPLLEQRRADLIHTAASILDKNSLIKYDKKTGLYQVTDLGRVASHYYVHYASMNTYNENLKPTMSDIELFRLFSLSHEFKFIAVRVDENLELEKLVERVPIPVKEGIDEASAKVNVLLQAYISRLRLDGFALIADMVYVTQSANRLLRALYEIVLKRGWAQMAYKLLNLCKMVDRRCWFSQSPLRQFASLPIEHIRKLERVDFPLERLYDLSPFELGELVPNMGKVLHTFLQKFPRLDLNEMAAHVQPITRSLIRVQLTVTPKFTFDEQVHGNAVAWWVIVEDVDGEKILHYEYFLLKKKFATEEHILSFTVPITDPLPPQYFVRIVADRWLGAEAVLPISFRHLIPPEKYPPHTELLDLQPLPVTALGAPQLQKLYRFEYFNAIQTQVFPTLYNTAESALICAPTGSGKTACAEFAVFQQLQQGPGKIVYIAPLAALATERLRDWTVRLGSLGLQVAELTGESLVDLKRLEAADVVIALPDQWDVLSRRWKQRKAVQAVRVFIVDELHLIGGEQGHVIEVIVSRMRYVAAQLQTKIRIVGLAASLANAKDLAEWMGCTPQTLFNFHPTVRPIPLEIHMQGFDNPHFASQLLLMMKPTVYAVGHHAEDKPVLIFVPTRKQTRRVASELLTYAESIGRPTHFVRGDVSDAGRLTNAALRTALEGGVGYLHEALPPAESALVLRLYAQGALQVLVCTNSLCWGLAQYAHLVVVMGTQFFDGKEHRYVDYPITDLLQMVGHAGRPGIDDSAKCVIFCHSPKKEFYKKFLYEPLPVESHLDHYLHDHLNSEVVTEVIENKQDAVDYLTWTFLYRRLTQNPNYYGLQGRTNRHLSDFLSELIESTVDDLATSKCLAVEGEVDLSPLNLGIITAYYYIKYTTVELFNANLRQQTRMKGLIEILSAVPEYDAIPIRFKESAVLKRLGSHLPMKLEAPNYAKLATKINILLQAHFSRTPLTTDLRGDQEAVVEKAVKLLQALVDVLSSAGWLSPALAAMDLSQMLVQAVWDNDADLRQLPHFSPAVVARCLARQPEPVDTVFGLVALEDAERTALLQLSAAQLADVARACNRYPNIGLQYEVRGQTAGEPVEVVVSLEREGEPGPVYAPYYPKPKPEAWWLVVGNTTANQLLSIKRVTMTKARLDTKLDFVAPAGQHQLTLFFMSDSYRGCDQEYDFTLNLTDPE